MDKSDPFHCTSDPCENPDPITVKVKACPPAIAKPGTMLEIFGTGTRIVIFTVLDIGRPGVTTVTSAVPGLAIRLAGTVAVKLVPPRYFVETGDPFHCTVEDKRKPEPYTVRVKVGPPAIGQPPNPGLRLVIVG